MVLRIILYVKFWALATAVVSLFPSAMSIFQKKIKETAMKIHGDSVGSLEYSIRFPPRKKIGITFRRHNEWGIVKVTPAGSDVSFCVRR